MFLLKNLKLEKDLVPEWRINRISLTDHKAIEYVLKKTTMYDLQAHLEEKNPH